MVTQISVRPSYTQVTSYIQWQTEGTKVRQSHILVVWAKFHAAGEFLQLYW